MQPEAIAGKAASLCVDITLNKSALKPTRLRCEAFALSEIPQSSHNVAGEDRRFYEGILRPDSKNRTARAEH